MTPFSVLCGLGGVCLFAWCILLKFESLEIKSKKRKISEKLESCKELKQLKAFK